MKNKKGLSKPLATVLIILQIIVAISVLFTFVYNFVKIPDIGLSFEKGISQYEIKDVNLWLTGGASIKIGNNAKVEEMNSMQIIFYDKNRNSHDLIISNPDRIPKLHETKTITLTIDEIPINNSEIERVSVFPTDGTQYGLESREPESLVQRDSSGNRILDAPPEAISWWRFDKTTKDHIGNNHGILQDDAVLTTDGETLLDGNGDYIDVGHHDNLDIKGNDWTISVWVKPEKLTSSQYIISKRDPATFANGQYAVLLYDNILSVFLFDESPKIANGQKTINLDEWSYLTAVYKKGQTLKTYVNGQYDSEVSISGAAYTNLEDVTFQIGSVAGTQFFQGLIDDVIIFQKALSENEIRAIYNNQIKS